MELWGNDYFWGIPENRKIRLEDGIRVEQYEDRKN
jgi:hypothetical protein